MEVNKAQAEDILVKSCFILNTQNKSDKVIGQGINYRLAGLKTIKIKAEDRNLYDAFFCSGNSIAEKIINSIKSCPIDTRNELFNNIVLIGGGCNLVGLHLALKE